MSDTPVAIPRTVTRPLTFANGTALGSSHRWQGGQYCSILTSAGIVGCGIYDLQTAAEFGQAIAICKGTPAKPLVEPEDLFESRIVGLTPQAAALGIQTGMTGREAVELLLKAHAMTTTPIGVKSIDHVTMVVADLDRSRRFYVDLLGMQLTERPGFKFAGLWFQAGATQVHLIQEHERSAPAGCPTPVGNASPGGTFHFAFEVDDCPSAVDKLKAAGVHVRGGPSLRPDGCVQTWCHDPDGHVVELFSRPRAS